MVETDEALLLDLLNTTPETDGEQRDDLAGAEAGRQWLAAHGQPSSRGDWQALRVTRDLLQDVVRGNRSAKALGEVMVDVRYRPEVDADGLRWILDLPRGRTAAVQAVLAWDELRRSSPGRLRPCANPDCRLFLIDHSKPNRARWCSMAVCGNRMKARRHYERTRQASSD